MESVIHFIVPALSFWNRSIYMDILYCYMKQLFLYCHFIQFIFRFWCIRVNQNIRQGLFYYQSGVVSTKKRIAIRQSFSGQLITQLFFLLKKMIPAAVMTAISITPAIKAESVGSEVSVGVFCETLRSVYASAYVEN